MHGPLKWVVLGVLAGRAAAAGALLAGKSNSAASRRAGRRRDERVHHLHREPVPHGGQAMKSFIPCAVLLALAAGPAWGQFQLYLVNGNIAQPVVQTYDLGDVAPGTSLAVPFQITNTSTPRPTWTC